MTTEKLENRLGKVLGIGSTVSTVCLAAGLAVTLLMPASRAAVIVMNAGLIVLLATPVARVIVATIGFAQEKEWRFVVMTAAVLAVLAGSVVAGLL